MEIGGETFAQKFDLFTCMQCGKCTGGCTVSLKSPLNVRRMMREALIRESSDVVLTMKELWDCTTCGTCTSRCPRGLDPAEVIIAMRGILIEEGRGVPKTIMEALESTVKNGNPWGRSRMKRTEWLQDFDQEVKDLTDGKSAELLAFIGCTPSYDPRVQEVARAFVRVFNAAGVDYGILGTEESCCGSEMHAMGEEGLFEMLVEENLELFNEFEITKMVTISPHCYNAFSNKYSEYGDVNFEVKHYTQFLVDLIDEDRLKLTKELGKVVTYHDPCYLGKHNSIFDEPRKVLEAIPGITFVEMDRSRERSLCCEGGGGMMWNEGAEGERTAVVRVRDAAEQGAEIIAVACPFCMLTLEDAVKTAGYEGQIEVKDILELLSESL
ncbi:MAG: Fe-S oxidoreductase [Candidatus Syntrophoarchaeum butanivorans]|nr:MAG: Fe-S oxidoreductase [Candidatus Syntrophoarchaeum butanivorans]